MKKQKKANYWEKNKLKITLAIKTIFFLFLLFAIPTITKAQENFITTWNVPAGTVYLPIQSIEDTIRVNWGDGTIDTCTNASLSRYSSTNYYYLTHVYSSALSGNTITISPLNAGEFTDGTSRFTFKFRIEFPGDDATKRSYFTDITQWGANQWETLKGMFYKCYFTNLSATDQPQPYIKNGATISAEGMFIGCASFVGTSTNLAWTAITPYINNMQEMFSAYNSTSSNNMAFNGDISSWDVSNVENMYRMFYYCTSFNTSIDAWGTNGSGVSKVETMSLMFYNASKFNQSLGSWEPSSCTDMSYMFYNAKAFNSSLFTSGVTGNVTDMSYMFSSNSYNANSAMAFNGDITLWDVSSVETMEKMFYNCRSFDQNIGSWNVSSVETMELMFYSCRSFNQNIESWNVSKVTTMKNMFNLATTFNQDLSAWKPTSCTTMYQMFYEANAFNGALFDATDNTGQVTDMYQMFYGADAFNQSIDHWQVDSVETMYGMFRGAVAYNQDMNSWNPERCKNMAHMFRGATAFDGKINNWDVGAVTTMAYMFYGASSFNQTITDWEPNSCTTMLGMFLNALSFDSPIFSSGKTGQVTNMKDMFNNAEAFNQDINSWEVDSVTTMQAMFANTNNFNGNISAWDVHRVTTMANMFLNALAFNGDLGAWKPTACTTMHSMFENAEMFNNNLFDPNFNTGHVTIMDEVFYNTDSFNVNIDHWQVDSVTTMINMFRNALSYNQPMPSWEPIRVKYMQHMFNNADVFNSDITTWDVSSVEQMDYMFANTDSFNVNLGAWKPSTCLDMQYMFSNAISFDTLLFTSGATGDVKNMSYMFYGVNSPVTYTKFNQDIDSWDVSSVTTMYAMFCRDTAFNQDLTSWDVSSVTTMQAMFAYAYNFNGDISTWNTSALLTMQAMFRSATSFDGDLGDWDVSKVQSLQETFYKASSYTGRGITNWDISGLLGHRTGVGHRGLYYAFAEASSFTANLGRWDMPSSVTFSAQSVFSNSGMIRADYDSTLIAWSNDDDFTNGTSKNWRINSTQLEYCEGAAARQYLFDNYGWNATYMNDVEDCTSPGGVTTELDLWLRADEEESTYTISNVGTFSKGGVGLDGTNVDFWGDYRNRAYNTSQTISENQPTYNEDSLYNFYPVISFDGAGSWLDIPDFVDKYSYQVFIVQKEATKGYLLGSDAADSTYNIGVKPTATGITFSNGCSGNGSNQSVSVNGRPNLIQVQNFDGNMKVALNGATSVTATNTVVTDDTLVNNFTIGTYNEGVSATTADYYDGDIAEIVFFDVERTGDEVQQIESYLAFKYGITLDQSTTCNYLASSGDTIWNADKAVAGGVTYNHDIFGIGLDSTSLLDQRIAKSSNDSAIVTLSTDNDFTSNNLTTSRTALTNNLSFQSIANNGGDAKWNDMSGGVYYLDRVWQVQETDSVGEVFLQFDVDDPEFDIPDVPAGNSLYIVYDSNNDGSLDGETPYALMTKTAGLYYTAAPINFTDGQIFTISSQSQSAAPGGVVSGLSLWLRADDDSIKTVNNSITYWDDYYNGQKVASYGPTLTHNAHNFNPGVTFDGDDYVQLFSGFSDFTEGITSFVFADLTTSSRWATFFSLSTGGSYDNAVIFRRDNYNSFLQYLLYPGTSNNTYDYIRSDGLVIGEDNIYGFYGTGGIATERTSTSYNFKNGELLPVNVYDYTTYVPASEYRTENYIGCLYNSGMSNFFIGDIPEVILYNRNISNIERLRVNSYLAIKYGLSLTQDNDGDGYAYETMITGITEGDYLASDSTVVWDAQPTSKVSDSIYNHNVMGIALDSLSRLDQRITHSTNEGTVMTIATDKDFVAANDTNRTAIGDDMSFFIIGDNDSTYASSKIDDLPTGYDARTYHEWRIQVTGSPAGVYWKIDTLNFAPAGCREYYLVISKNEDFTNIETEIRIDDNNETETALQLSADTYYATLAMKVSKAPGGVKSGVSLWLRADDDSLKTVNDSISYLRDFFSGQEMISYGPDLTANAHNFNPGITFVGNGKASGDYIDVFDGFADFTAGLSAFVFANPTTRSYFERFFDFGNGASNNNIVFFRYSSYVSTLGFQINLTSQYTRITDACLTNNEDNIYGVYNTGGIAQAKTATTTLFKNGGNQQSASSMYIPNTITRTSNYIGKSNWSNDYYYNGDIPEVILYNRNISDIERLRVNSYLAIKYGLTMTQDNDGDDDAYETMITGITEGDYLASDSTVVWNASPASLLKDTLYNHHIFGLGLDTTSVLDQRVAHSNSDSLGVILATDRDFTSVNDENRTVVGDNMTFIMVGNNDSSFVVSSVRTLPAGYDGIMPRIWRAQVTGNPADLYLKFGNLNFAPNTKREYYLLVSDNDDFSTLTNSIRLNANNETESALQWADGEVHYFTIALKAYQAPGGVAAALSLWLRADDGFGTNNADEWTDYFSGDSCTIYGAKNTLNVHNFNPGIIFDGTDDYIDVFDGFRDFTAGMTAYVFANPTASGYYARFFDFGNGQGNNNIDFGRYKTAATLFAQVYYRDGTGNDYVTSSGLINNEDNIYGFYNTGGIAQAKTATRSLFINGAITATGTSKYIPNTITRRSNFIGQLNWNMSTHGYFQGDIPEIIIYNRYIGSLDRLRIDSYLALKYGFTLPHDKDADGTDFEPIASGITEGDYLASDTTVIWDAKPTTMLKDSIYNHNIIGVALDSVSGLNQRISHSYNENTVVTISTDKEFTAANSDARTAIGDDMSFFIIGDNDSTYAGNKIDDLPTGYDARTFRQWRVQVTGSPAGVYWKIDTLNFAPAGCREYYLVISKNEDFTNIETEIKIDDNNETETALQLSADTYYATLAMKVSKAPGGVKSGVSLWMRADDDSLKTVNDSISYLRDFFSGQEMISYGPDLTPNTHNFNPGILFDGTDDYVDVFNGFADFTAGITNFVFANPISKNTYARFWDFGNVSGNDNVLFERYYNGTTFRAYVFPSNNHTTNSFVSSPGMVFGEDNIYGFYNSGGVAQTKTAISSIFFNGSITGTNTAMYVPNVINRERNYIGKDNWGGTNLYKGSLPELIIYNRNISDIERLRVNSYLAIKYGLTMTQDNDGNGTNYDAMSSFITEGDYLASDSTVVWDAYPTADVSDSIYNHQIFGIGLDTVTVLNQRISHAQNDADLIIATDRNFTAVNDDGRTALGSNLTFVMVGNNDSSFVATKLTDIPSGYDSRIYRQWRVQVTGSATDVFLKLDTMDFAPNTAREYYLVVSQYEDFSTIDNQILIDENNEVDGVNLTAGVYYMTVAMKVKIAPGGVSGDVFWYRADANNYMTLSGSSVTEWNDYSGNGNDLTKNGTSTLPVYNDIALNFNPSLYFNSTKLYTDTADITELHGSASFETFSVTFRSGGDKGTFLYYGTETSSSNSGYAFDFYSGKYLTIRDGSGYKYFNYSADITDFHIYNFNYIGSGSSDDVHVFCDNDSLTVNFDNDKVADGNISGKYIMLGARGSGSQPNYLTGNIAETFVYPRKLTAFERQKVQSYLALKYGITLDQSSGEYDYLANDSTVIWDASNAVVNGKTYNHDIFGIGRDDMDSLYQRISKSINDSAIVTLSLNDDFTSSNLSRSENIDDLNFQTIANNGGGASWSGEMVMPNHFIALKRIWQVQETGTIGDVYLQFDVDNPDFNVDSLRMGDTYYLIYDSDNDSELSDETPIALTQGTSSNLWYTATPVNFTNGQIFTLASQVYSPGGVSINLQLWLRADKGFDSNDADEWTDFFNGDSCTIDGAVENANSHNFNPGVTFDGTDDYIDVYDGFADFTKGLTSFSIFNTSTAREMERVYRLGPYKLIRNYAFVFSNDQYRQTYVTDYYNNNNAAFYRSNADVQLGIDGLYGFSMNAYSLGTAPNVPTRLIFNGSISTAGNLYPLQVVERVANYMGASFESDGLNNYFTGEIPELVIYNRHLSDIEQARVNSYLAIKYGLTLSQDNDGDETANEEIITGITEGDYLASDSTVIWDASAAILVSNESYNNDIFGIGVDRISVLDQRVSQSVSDSVLTLATDKDFTSANTALRTAFSNDTAFFMVANNDSTILKYKKSATPAGYDMRTKRQWKAQLTNFNDAVYMKFGGRFYSTSARELYVVFSENEDFSTITQAVRLDANGETETALSGLSPDGTYYFTVAMKVNVAPGGVAQSLELWVRADDSISVNSGSVDYWYDYFNGDTCKANSLGTAYPSYVDNSHNFNPGVAFDGSNGYFDVYAGFEDFTDGVTAFALANSKTSTNTAGYGAERLWSVGSVDEDFTNGLVHTRDVINNRIYFTSGIASNTLSTVFSTTTITKNRDAIYGFSLASFEDPGTSQIKDVNASLYENSGQCTSSTEFYRQPIVKRSYNQIGYFYNSTSSAGKIFTGDIPELVIYTRNISAIERRRVDSYLAIKYGLTLSQNNDGDGTPNEEIITGITEGDYLASDSTVIWDASTYSSYSNNICGIGTDSVSMLIQKVSRSNTDTTLVIAYDADFTSPNLATGRTALANNEFIVVGHDGADSLLQNSYYSIRKRRMNRIWVANVTGDPKNMYVAIPNTFNFSRGVPIVIISDDNNIELTDNYIEMTETGGYYHAKIPVAANTNFWFTFGIKDDNSQFMRHGKHFKKAKEREMTF